MRKAKESGADLIATRSGKTVEGEAKETESRPIRRPKKAKRVGQILQVSQ